jgi:hypothetical protein
MNNWNNARVPERNANHPNNRNNNIGFRVLARSSSASRVTVREGRFILR